PQTKEVLYSLHEIVEKESEAQNISKSEVRFTRREVRERLGVSDTRLRVHLRRLEELEYLVVRSGRQGQIAEYELLYDGEGKEGEEFALGLSFGRETQMEETNTQTQERSLLQKEEAGDFLEEGGLFAGLSSWKELLGLAKKSEAGEVV
ncbi:DNA primase, partial [Leptospira santarosai]